eukprot:86055-Pelagomonas_calceolata.AAC.8
MIEYFKQSQGFVVYKVANSLEMIDLSVVCLPEGACPTPPKNVNAILFYSSEGAILHKNFTESKLGLCARLLNNRGRGQCGGKWEIFQPAPFCQIYPQGLLDGSGSGLCHHDVFRDFDHLNGLVNGSVWYYCITTVPGRNGGKSTSPLPTLDFAGPHAACITCISKPK